MLTLLKMWATGRHIRAQPDPRKGVCQSCQSPHRLKPENERRSTTTSYVVPCCSPKSVTPPTTLTRLKNISTGTAVYYDPCSMKTCWWSRQRLWPWMDNDCFRLYCHSKRLEKCYRKSSSAEDCLEWVQQQRHRHSTYRQKETIYWNLGLSADASSSKKTVAFTELAGGITQE